MNAAAATDHTLTINDLDLHYRAWGRAEAPALLLLHGSSGHAQVWDDVAAALAGDYHLIALDLRGHGESAWVRPPAYRFADYAADVRAVVGELGPGPVVLVGYSMGALVALRLAAEGGLPLRGLALLDIEATPPAYQARALNAAGERPARPFPTLDVVAAYIARGQGEIDPARLAAYAAAGVRALPDGGYTLKADREVLRAFEQVNYRPYLPRVPCPALVLRGAESTVMRREVARAMAAALPHGRVVEIPAAGHLLPVQQPAAVAAALRDWLVREVAPASG